MKSNLKKFLLIGLSIFILLGLVYLSSASIVAGRQEHNNPWYFVFNQILKGVIPGLIIFLIMSKIRINWLKKLSGLMLIVNTLMLVALRIPGIGVVKNGATRWINVFGFEFQPSEFLKITLVIFLATFLSGKTKEKLSDWKSTIIPFVIILGAVLGLLFIQPATSIAAILALTAMIMLFSTNISIPRVAMVSIVLGLAFIGIIMFSPYKYRLQRLTDFSNKNTEEHFQLKQAKIGISRGGIIGVGFGQSRQKYNYLPESYTDSIFSVIAEEFGFVFGTVIVLGLYLALFFYGTHLARHTNDDFTSLIAIGTVSWITIQSLMHISCMSGLIPLTGLPLPFISYGGSAFVTVMASIGLLNNLVSNN